MDINRMNEIRKRHVQDIENWTTLKYFGIESDQVIQMIFEFYDNANAKMHGKFDKSSDNWSERIQIDQISYR